MTKKQKDSEILTKIKEIFDKNYQKYGYRRITMKLKQLGYDVNHKRVQRIMKENNIKAAKPKRKYRSYKGNIGIIAPNVLEQQFETTEPLQKIGTDLTLFITRFGKLYLSPVIDFHTREVLAYDLAETPNYNQIIRMLDELYSKFTGQLQKTIMHSDQGWQYQMKAYVRSLEQHGLIQSMSRKGNCLDNSPTECFFSRLKTEMYYEKMHTFQSLNEVKKAIHEYIRYYNEERIVLKTSVLQHNVEKNSF